MSEDGYLPNELLGRLVGSRLSSVNFVYDYVQLHFDRPGGDQPILTCDAMPTVTVANGTYAGRRCRSLVPGH
ncbi:hypothetical protein [Amycolatopsis regifaucium]|uniref:Uncharacterized protein n=1 Tax=Amycolatopsis regifaucium TaxID=546365 RepID=A0A154MFD4_9PSEU|nr:hypothetical protein [Amycolatopsis regifaucium]KZB83172.1 hypothetical protein AVL48_36770 [Amycolatopsis regifaucium]OKA03176.1 hypothetical protein ATP06_0237230 [Amycolatopsis regifaucium]SFJ48363.1 hypothetical protein SAMN04489731_12275 [Amycolatopsis regifaucium]